MSQQVNLYNPIFRPRGFSFTSAQAMLYAIGIAVGLIAAATVYSDYELRQIASRAQASDRAHKDATAKLAQITGEVAQQKPNAQIEADVAALEAQFKGRQEIVETLRSGSVGNTAGFSEYMRAFSRQTISGLWLSGFEIDGNDLVLHGRTFNPESVAGFLKQLNREPALQGREFSAMRIRQPPTDAAADAAAKADADKAQKDAKAPPRYLEFSISTAPLPEEPQRPVARPAAATAAAPAQKPAASGTASPVAAIDTSKVIEAVNASLKQGAAK